MENVRILFARPLKIGQCEFLGVFHLPSKFSMGFYPDTGLRPKYGRIFFSPMSMYKEFNSTCITLVAFFYPMLFLVENRAWKSIYFLTPNRQYNDAVMNTDFSKAPTYLLNWMQPISWWWCRPWVPKGTRHKEADNT